jgi:hypothetical protein
LQKLLFDIYGINATCLRLILILIRHIIFKFNKYIKVNLSSVLGTKFIKSLEYYVNKIIVLNKEMSILYIWLILKETKNLSGIYHTNGMVTCDYYYIGSAYTNRFYARFSNHLLYLKESKTCGEKIQVK